LSPSFDARSVEWRRVTDPSVAAYRIDFEYSLLASDLALGRRDMLLRYAPGRGDCRRHRHVASTLTLVLEGEQRRGSESAGFRSHRRTKSAGLCEPGVDGRCAGCGRRSASAGSSPPGLKRSQAQQDEPVRML